ncbi:CD3324 family protein [Paenibacillus chibensis]|uniref:CD3324 family protein n=1 Tax=Paenibacillus chibensis TaxID=59846 RepID=A0ABU6PRB7_9BACL|nr:CD3324 family protein [Paenibacillus chibensis]MEC0372738.1 CD3324 family protein [Paenibacillus chibensis]MED5017429.1 CD3324 family protein [Paenibacillus chibensis]
MAYVKAANVLPETLISEIQKYVQGDTIYIPRLDEAPKQWGSRSGTRKQIDDRNAAIRKAFAGGGKIPQLADEYHLSVDSIRKIVYSKPKR